MADGKIGEAVAEQAAGGRGAFDPDRVQMIDIDTLVLDPANVRTHPQRNIDAIVGSLQAFGQQKPVVVDADNVVRAGNGLVRAARLLGWSQVAAYTTGLGGSEAIAFAIADNRTAELSEWDDDGLAAQVEALLAEGVQVESLGWTEDELADLMADDYPTPDADPVEVAADAESARGKCPCAAMGLCVPTQPSQIGSEQG
jgi:ParB-like chromosome segregation protein Spo0J